MKEAEKKTNKFLYFAVTIVNIASFSCGIAFGWSSPIIPKLNGSNGPNENPLEIPITKEEESWIASLISLGATFGTVTGGYAFDKIGRKKTLVFSLIPLITSFMMSAFATNLLTFYVARFIVGLVVGIVLTIVPMYIGEIAEVGNRGILGCFMGGLMAVGYLFSFTVGPYLSVLWFNLACAIGPVLCLIIMLYIPESPLYLIEKNQCNCATKSLLKYRYNHMDIVEKELLEITGTVKECATLKCGICDIFKSRGLIKGLFISVGLMTLQQASGISVILFYLQSIFESAGSGISSDISTIIVGITQIIGVICACLIVDRLGRKILLFTSTIGTSLMLSALGTYFFLKENSYNVDCIFWLPITSLIIYIGLYNLGLGPLPCLILGELFPPHVKSVASTITTCTCFTLSFGTAKLLPFLLSMMGMGCSLWFLSVLTMCGVFFLKFIVPETKGKTFNEITNELNR